MRARRLVRKLLGRKKSGLISELSTPAIHGAILRAIENAAVSPLNGDHLDVGSGSGDLLALIAARYPIRSSACDYTDQLMKLPGQPVEIVNLDREPLPYETNRFALVTCAETIEHLENYRGTLREIYRVLKPGGVAVVSTPNILNLRSRLHYLTFGFPALFGPLAPGEQKIYSPRGHINPVSWFYLAHALLETGFTEVKLSVDRYQRRSLITFILFSIPIYMGGAYAYQR
jgi:ubiquinone/menaquinone biosynthesis C-methylase UbiE